MTERPHLSPMRAWTSSPETGGCTSSSAVTDFDRRRRHGLDRWHGSADARALIDIGAGIGSVGLMTLHSMGPRPGASSSRPKGQPPTVPKEHRSQRTR